jgi:hypothetical protein
MSLKLGNSFDPKIFIINTKEFEAPQNHPEKLRSACKVEAESVFQSTFSAGAHRMTQIFQLKNF